MVGVVTGGAVGGGAEVGGGEVGVGEVGVGEVGVGEVGVGDGGAGVCWSPGAPVVVVVDGVSPPYAQLQVPAHAGGLPERTAEGPGLDSTEPEPEGETATWMVHGGVCGLAALWVSSTTTTPSPPTMAGAS